MFNQILQAIQNKGKSKKQLTWLAIVLGIFALIFILWPRKGFQQYEIKATSLNSSLNFAKLTPENTLYYYNGASFISKNITSGEETILSSGSRLPVPDKLFWADSKGALMTFKDSYYYTKVQDELTNMGKKIDKSTKKYTWYLDFSSGRIFLAHVLPLDAESAYYSAKDSKFYFMDSAPVLEEGPNLLAFDTNSFKSSIASSALDITGFKSLEGCPTSLNNSLVCIIALDRGDPKNENLYSINQDSSLTKVFESSGLLLPTSQPEKYLSVLEEPDNKDEEPIGEEAEGGGFHGPAALIDVIDKSTQKLGFEISGAGSAISLGSDGTFYVLDNFISGKVVKKKTPYYYRSGVLSRDSAKSKQYDAKMDGNVFESLFINESGYGQDGLTLMNDFDGDQLLFAKKGSPGLILSDKSKVQIQVESCSKNITSSSVQYFGDTKTFRLYFDNTQQRDTNIARFADCLNKSSFFGYNISYYITAPGSGKIISD